MVFRILAAVAFLLSVSCVAAQDEPSEATTKAASGDEPRQFETRGRADVRPI